MANPSTRWHSVPSSSVFIRDFMPSENTFTSHAILFADHYGLCDLPSRLLALSWSPEKPWENKRVWTYLNDCISVSGDLIRDSGEPPCYRMLLDFHVLQILWSACNSFPVLSSPLCSPLPALFPGSLPPSFSLSVPCVFPAQLFPTFSTLLLLICWPRK